MSFKPSLNERRYFVVRRAARRQAVRLELERAAKALKERQHLGETLGTDDEELLREIHDLGFTQDTARVFDLLPLVHVSWADGRIQQGERAEILGLVEERGIKINSRAFLLMESLLEQRPSNDYLDITLALLRRLLKDTDRAGDIVELCIRVAETSGGLLGVGSKVHARERELIARVAEHLGQQALQSFQVRFAHA
jgi:tellurite resistance protein